MDYKKRNFIIFILLLLIEIIIALFVHDNFIRPYIGDVLVIAVIYFFIKSITSSIKYVAIYVLLFAVLIEIGQYFNMVLILDLENNKFFKILLGSTFDWKDIFCYIIGCIILLVFEKLNLIKN